jgi:uncharacterized delta-60 repeat protein
MAMGWSRPLSIRLPGTIQHSVRCRHDYARGIALQQDCKIVVAGEKRTISPFFRSFDLARYNTDGTPDTTFNVVGKRAFSVIAAANSYASDVIVQSDGKIVVLGVDFGGFQDYALVRLNSGGGFDTTFSGDGKIFLDFLAVISVLQLLFSHRMANMCMAVTSMTSLSLYSAWRACCHRLRSL